MDGPKILRSEVQVAVMDIINEIYDTSEITVQAALKKIKRHKAARPDEIVTEMITSLEEYGVSKVTDIINEIYDASEILDDLYRSIFIALHKKPARVKCKLHRTISLISPITKLILRIIMERVCSRIRLEIKIEQCGFIHDTGKRNAIFMVRMISERAIEKQRCLHVFFDYRKIFDWVQQDELLKMLMN